jgi:hypothetical protein
MIVDKAMSALERLSNQPESAAKLGTLGADNAPPAQSLNSRVAELQMKLNSVEIEHAEAIREMHQRLHRLEQLIGS